MSFHSPRHFRQDSVADVLLEELNRLSLQCGYAYEHILPTVTDSRREAECRDWLETADYCVLIAFALFQDAAHRGEFSQGVVDEICGCLQQGRYILYVVHQSYGQS